MRKVGLAETVHLSVASMTVLTVDYAPMELAHVISAGMVRIVLQ